MNAFEQRLQGRSPEFQAVTRSAQVAAATDVTVLLLGASGTGKELLAQALHEESRRREGPFVTINCAALPENLAESELFGHRKGAFTGAVADHSGRIRAADGGTLFLDEVGELSPAIQAKLLRFLESGEVQAIGETGTRRVDVRVVAATHRDLFSLVREGAFREDLYYRLNVVPLEVPALKDRTGDVALLLDRLTGEIAGQHGLEAPRFSKAAVKALEGYAWPGNVRELRNFCERMVVLLPGQAVEPSNLPREMLAGNRGGAKRPFSLPEDGIRLDELEQEMIRQALDRTGGNRSRAARLLGLTRDTLLYRIKKYAL